MSDSTQNITIRYNVESDDLKRAKNELSSLSDEEKVLKSELDKANRSLERQADTIVQNADKQRQAVKKQERSVEELQGEYAVLKRAIDTTFDPKKVVQYNKALNDTEKELKSINAETKKSKSGLSSLSSTLNGVGIAFLSAFAVDKIIEYTKAFIQLEKQIAQTRGTIRRLSKTQGEDLDELTAKVRALAGVYEIAESELIKVANALSTQANVSFAESLNLIEKGFLQVGNSSGEFADSIREYTRLLIEAGATAEEVVKIAAIQDLEGVYNDRLIDTIFNFSNELKDADKAMKALSATFGTEFANRALVDFRNGTATALDILQRVGREAEKTGKSTKELSRVTTDLGTGVAEDLGGILVAYELYNKALNLNADSLDRLGVRQKALLDSSQRYEASLVRLAGNFEGLGEKTQLYAQGAGRVLANLLNDFVELFGNSEDRLKKFKEELAGADATLLGDSIERSQQRVNQLSSQLASLNVTLEETKQKQQEAGAFSQGFGRVLAGLGANISSVSAELAEEKTKLDLLIESKEKAIEVTEKQKEENEDLAKAQRRETGIIENLRKEIALATTAREQAVSEESIDRLNKRIKLLNEELQALLSIGKAQEDAKIADIERLEVGRQVSDELLKVEKKNIEELAESRRLTEAEIQAIREEALRRTLEIGFEISNAYAGFLSSITDFRSAQVESELSELRKLTDERIRLAGDNDKAIQQIQEQAAVKEQQLLEKQARIRKNAQLQQAIIAGIQGVAQAIARGDLAPFNFVLAGIIAAQTAVQVAAIKSTPAFKDGTEYVEGAGTSRSDSIDAKLSKGERVVPTHINKDLKGISNKDLPEYVRVATTFKELMPTVAIQAGNATSKADVQAVSNAIKEGFSGVQVSENNYDEKGYSRYLRKKDSRVRIIDKSNSL